MEGKVLVIGNLNFFVKELSEDLTKDYSVQICPIDTSVLLQTTAISIPDIIILYINSIVGDVRDELVKFVEDNEWVSTKHLMIIGSFAENEYFRERFSKLRVRYLTRPISILRVRETIALMTGGAMPVNDTKPKNGDVRKHVLAVDDDAVLLRSMKAMLEEHFRVTIARTGVAALTAIGRDRPDLILLDYEMPMSDGKQVFEMIRADEETCNIPVFFLTGVTDAKRIKEVLALKPQGYILKSTKNNKVVERLKEFFEENPD